MSVGCFNHQRFSDNLVTCLEEDYETFCIIILLGLSLMSVGCFNLETLHSRTQCF